MILGQRALTFPDPTQEGIRVSEPPKEGAAPVWYDPVGAFAAAGFLGDIYAWRAIDTPGSPWAGGPANYAATLIDENNGQTLVEGNGAVAWAANTGWQFTAALLQYFDTGLTPANDQSWSMFVQFAGQSDTTILCGARSGVAQALEVSGDFGVPARYANGAFLNAVPDFPTGNIGVSGNRGYRNGGLDIAGIGAYGGAMAHSIYIGARNNLGAAIFHTTADIAVVWICTSNPATVQANVASLVTAMGQL